MPHLNVEFKARCAEPSRLLHRLVELGAQLQGVDAQTDVYYRAARGRLKLRRGTVESNLIAYERRDAPAARESRVHLAELPSDRSIDAALDAALQREATVTKRRHILWLDNVKFHVDEVAGLGAFVEVEAIDRDGMLGASHLEAQCNRYRQLLGIRDEDLEARSYSDLLSG
jgi:predicted adenylyl cyclase CyaB